MENVIKMLKDFFFFKAGLKWCYKHMEYLCFMYFLPPTGKDNDVWLDYLTNFIMVKLNIHRRDTIV